MNNVTTFLTEEKIRLENINATASQRFMEASIPGIVQRPAIGPNNEERLVNYIDLDRFSDEQKQIFDTASKRAGEIRARIAVLDNFIKARVSAEALQSYNQYVPPLERFHGVTIPCSSIDLDENMQMTRCTMRVGTYDVECPREMAFEQYAELYSNSLSQALVRSLGTEITQEEIMQILSEACTEVYLNPPSLQIEEGTLGMAT